ncbi:tyrosine-type recombinase/integrase [Lachnospira multipara]|uniref:tyrosine-type recombinase/integrase n=1 Tax=Lachnospira multipara TaxID=28051 RepID=UPI00047FC962|nr:tyrosine-type recombinase/integrase [Lachnospira multipara]
MFSINKVNLDISKEFNDKIWIYFETNLKARTRKEYYNVVTHFTKCVGHDPYYLTLEDTKTFYEDLLNKINKEKLSYSTAVMRYSVMRSICDFIENYKINHGEEYTNYFKEFSLPEQDKTIKEEDLPSLKDIDLVLNKCIECNDYRAFTIFSLCLKLGLTNTEVCHLTMENVLLVDEEHLALSLNNNKRIRRILELDTDLSKILDKYLSDYEIAHGPLFYNNRNNQIKMRDTERLLQKYIDMVNTPKERIAPFTMQSLRHIAMIMLLKGNVSKENVAKFGGITTKWMNRYERIVNKNDVDINGRMSIISINPGY